MMTKRVIHWFRQDLRLSDNPALVAAAQQGDVIPVYILDDNTHTMGAASRCWLHHSLQCLNESLQGHLIFTKGDPLTIIPSLVNKYQAEAVTWNRCYEPDVIQRDTKLKKVLKAQGTAVSSHNSALLWEPWQVHKADGTPYKVFTPFYRRGCLNAEKPRQPIAKPTLSFTEHQTKTSLKGLDLLPTLNWHEAMMQSWQVGENAAQQQLDQFIEVGLQGYKVGRDFPHQHHVSRLSPYLHFGEISPNQVWHSIRLQADSGDADHFCSELGWREFSYYQLYHFPTLPTQNLNKKFDAFPWEVNEKWLLAWQQGKTGYPIIDAGMRELWRTGYMHNRVRMIVASFLVKNLLMPWQVGERWFWDCLVDADVANNSTSWQWVAGCGADAAPYFRIFNPVTQSEKFDPEGDYIRQYIPEISQLPTKYLHKPWTTPELILNQCSIKVGVDYLLPIVDLKVSRETALSAFKSISGTSN